MKKIALFALALILIVGLMAGCRRQNAGETTTPTGDTIMPTMDTTRTTTMPTRETTMPTTIMGTEHNTDDTNNATNGMDPSTAGRNRGRIMPMG